jgi:hypothetical protein
MICEPKESIRRFLFLRRVVRQEEKVICESHRQNQTKVRLVQQGNIITLLTG